MDPAKQRGMNEKITDKARGMFEKATGYESFLGPLFLVCGVAVVCIFVCGVAAVCIGSGWALLVVGVVGASC